VRTKAELESQIAELQVRLSRWETSPERGGRFRFYMTIALGVGIPLLSLTMSFLAGKMAGGGLYKLAAFASVIGGVVLVVSLTHLATAIAEITGSTLWASWFLAIAVDLSLVLAELVQVYAPSDLELGRVSWTVMVSVCAFSMALNVYAFLAHRPIQPHPEAPS
jgi:hypothetical protein